jgi:DNA polymerase elongation subunit (family B)
MQLAKKIQLNSAYGALGNEYFRWFSFDHAEAITKSGQLSIRWIEKKINTYMNNLLKTEDEDYVIASDTDSIYVNMEKLVNTLDTKDENVIVSAIDRFCELKILPYIDKSYKELAIRMNAFQQKMRMKRETIANKGIWKAKKMYILNAWNIEGVQFNEPVLKIQGIEAVRSSTPQACRKYIKEALKIIMNKTESDLQDYIEKIKSEYKKLPFDDIAFPRGVNNLEEYSSKSGIYSKGAPIQVRASLLFNNLLKKHKLYNIQPISSGDKIKFCYLKLPNPINENTIANLDSLPKTLDIEPYVDYNVQFNKSFIEPIKSITDVIGWEPERKISLDKFFK